MRQRSKLLALVLGATAAVAALVLPAAAPRPAQAADAPAPTAADFQRLEAELARVQQDLRDQRQLILQLMQMHDALLRYVGSGGAAAGGPPPQLPPGAGAGPGTAGGRPLSPSGGPGRAAVPGAAAPAAEAPRGGGGAGNAGSISGRVVAASGQLGEAYVYLDGPKATPSRPGTVEIKQMNKQFVPAVSVIPVGTRISFPNADKVFHNVFSTTPGDAFDLGTLKAGDRPNPVVLLKPGHVEIFCNIHSKMRADVLVVPNQHWTRVRPDGTFQLAGVPLGSRRLVLWGPGLKPASEKVDVTPAGASATLNAEATSVKPHLNKQGGAYGSYDD